MTTERFELQMEGSNDGKTWSAYRFKYKPNTVKDLQFAGLHMPRLDWQMWFAALYPKCSRRWLFYLMDALFDASKPVLSILSENPFPNAPPQYLRIQKSKRTFTDSKHRSTEGSFWTTTASNQVYCPMVDQSTLSRSKLTRAHRH
ncbi:MAG: lipase maturation factor family protein [Bradymonadia bacterium]